MTTLGILNRNKIVVISLIIVNLHVKISKPNIIYHWRRKGGGARYVCATFLIGWEMVCLCRVVYGEIVI